MLITHTAILKTKKKLASQVYLLRFSYPENNDWTFRAGQYMIFHLPSLRPSNQRASEGKAHDHDHNNIVRRLYSIASAPSQKNTLDFVIELVSGGVGSEYIAQMHEDDEITMQGPAGIFTLSSSGRDIVMLATGTGIAPMYSMIQEISNFKFQIQNSKTYLFWGLKYKKNIYLKQELDKLADENPNFQYSICLSREENVDDARCLKGRVTHGLESIIKNYKLKIENCDYYLCGSPNVVEALREDLKNKGVPKEQIYFEKFT